jgi:hypothetical protein
MSSIKKIFFYERPSSATSALLLLLLSQHVIIIPFSSSLFYSSSFAFCLVCSFTPFPRAFNTVGARRSCKSLPNIFFFFSIYDIREQEEEKNSGVYDFSLFFVGLKNIFLSFFAEYKEKKYEGTLFWRKEN